MVNFRIDSNLPPVNYNPQPMGNFIDAAMSGVERGQTLGLRARQQALLEEQAAQRKAAFEAEQKQRAIENIKAKSDMYNSKWFKGMSQADKTAFHRSFIKDLGTVGINGIDDNSEYHDNDSETAQMLGDMFKDKNLSADDRRLAAASILSEAQRRGSDKEYLDELRKTAQLGMTKDPLEYALQAAKLDALKSKTAATAEKANGLLQGQLDQADLIIGKVDSALNKVSGLTAGMGGRLKNIPMTSAKDLATDLETIKANLGFAQLQEMRRNSPTGGALGAISEKELVALQSALASLDQEQSPEQLKKNLGEIKTHYANWKALVLQSNSLASAQPKTSFNVTFVDSDGEQHTIPASNLEAAKQRDPGLKVIQ